ncbi:MAG: hypothetical protein QM796_07815 [Chthoniobacteraceae bacterium]
MSRRSDLRAAALAAACAVLAVGAAAEPDSPDLELVATPGWRQAALTAPPFSLLRDPGAAPVVAHVRDQLATFDQAMMVGSDLPPLLPLALHLDGVVFATGVGPDGSSGGFGNGAVLALEGGEAADSIDRWLDRQLLGVGTRRTAWEEFNGYFVDTSLFLGRSGSRFVLGDPEQLPLAVQRLAALAAAPPDPRIAMTWRLRPALERATAESAWTAVAIDESLGAWRGTSPVARVDITAGAGCLAAETVVSALPRLPLATIDGEIAAAARSGHPVTLALHLDPLAVARLLQASGCPVQEEIDAVAPQLTGDVLVQAGWSAGPLPQGAALLRLHDGGEAAAPLATLASALGATAVEREGADQAFELVTPAGAQLILRRGERLVIGSDQALIASWLAGQAGDAPLPAGFVVQLDADLPAIARQWLPWAWVALAAMDEPLGADPEAALDELAWELRDAFRRVAPPASVSDALSHGDPEAFAAREDLRRLFPGPDLAQAIDAACAVYVPQPPAAPVDDDGMPQAKLVLRFADGFTVVGPDGRDGALDAAKVAEEVAGWKHVFGPDPAALVQLQRPEPVVFDGRWLPPVAVALRHVPAYHLEVASADFSLRVSERGLPLVALVLIWWALE